MLINFTTSRVQWQSFTVLKMCSLALFPPPLPSGQTTLCESNNELLSRTTTDDLQKQESSPLSLYFPESL